jgi:hypothetical protein
MNNKTYIFEGTDEKLKEVEQLINCIMEMYQKDTSSMIRVNIYKNTMFSECIKLHKDSKRNLKDTNIEKIYLSR